MGLNGKSWSGGKIHGDNHGKTTVDFNLFLIWTYSATLWITLLLNASCAAFVTLSGKGRRIRVRVASVRAITAGYRKALKTQDRENAFPLPPVQDRVAERTRGSAGGSSAAAGSSCRVVVSAAPWAVAAGLAPGATPSTASDSAGSDWAAVAVGRTPAAAIITNRKMAPRPVNPMRMRWAVETLRRAVTEFANRWRPASPGMESPNVRCSSDIDPRFALIRHRSLPGRRT